jgi:hypothetical protein
VSKLVVKPSLVKTMGGLKSVGSLKGKVSIHFLCDTFLLSQFVGKSKAIEPAETAKGSMKSDEAKEVKSKKEKANPMMVSAF